MPDNRDLAALTGNAALDEVTYSGDTAVVQVMRDAEVTGAEGSKTVQPLDKRVVDTDKARRVVVIGDPTTAANVAAVNASGALTVQHLGAIQAQGQVENDEADLANPVVVGGHANAAAPADVSANGDAVSAWFLRNGAQAVNLTAAGALIPGNATDGLKVNLGADNDVTVASLPLPAGAATETTLAAVKTAVEILDNIVAGSEAQVDVITLPADPLGANADAVVAAGAAGSLSAKLRRLTQDQSDGNASITTMSSNVNTMAGYIGDTAAATVAAGATGSVTAKLRRLTADTDGILTAIQILDNAISGSEMQVDIVAALPAGTNAIGKLAANSGVDIGDVDVLSIVPVTATTATLTNTNDSATNVTVQASNAARKGLILHNDSTQIAYVKFGATATTTSYSVKLPPDATYHMGSNIYSGIVDAIWAADGSGAMRATEW